jgi:hypothetical protein
VTVQGASLYEAAAAAIAAFRTEAWAADALTPNAVLNVEVLAPPVLHAVPLKAVERWLRSPNASPREMAIKRRAGGPGRG